MGSLQGFDICFLVISNKTTLIFQNPSLTFKFCSQCFRFSTLTAAAYPLTVSLFMEDIKTAGARFFPPNSLRSKPDGRSRSRSRSRRPGGGVVPHISTSALSRCCFWSDGFQYIAR